MTHRLGRYWAVLHSDLGLNPHHSDCWTLDEALVAEVYVDDVMTARRIAAARARTRR